MATATQTKPRKPRTVKAPHGVARLFLAIDRAVYCARPIAADPDSGVAKMLRLTKGDATRARYYLARHADGSLSCDCPSMAWDHDGHPEHPRCKHLAAASAVGLL
jgi:hypothetical protein